MAKHSIETAPWEFVGEPHLSDDAIAVVADLLIDSAEREQSQEQPAT